MAKRRRAGHTSNGRGNLLVERTFPAPVGVVRMSSGTKDTQALKDINDMLTAFARGVPPRYDLLLAIKAGTIAPMHALSMWRLNRLHEAPTADVLPPLSAAYERWFARLQVSEQYRSQIASTFRQLQTYGSEPTVGDVVALLQARRDVCQDAGYAVSFNRSKAHVQAFVRDTLGDDHQLYRAVTKIPTLKVESEPNRRAQQPADLQRILAVLPPAPYRAAMSLAVTGMRPREYFTQAWNVWYDRVKVHKGKTRAAQRELPLWSDDGPLTPDCSRGAFEGAWERAVGDRLGIYDLRRSFAVWMEDAGIPRSRRKIYLGHATGDVTGMYERRELDAWLAEDANRLQRYWCEATNGRVGNGAGVGVHRVSA